MLKKHLTLADGAAAAVANVHAGGGARFVIGAGRARAGVLELRDKWGMTAGAWACAFGRV